MVTLSFELYADEIVDDMDVSDLWDLIQVSWSRLERDGTKEDWESFYEDNDVILWSDLNKYVETEMRSKGKIEFLTDLCASVKATVDAETWEKFYKDLGDQDAVG